MLLYINILSYIMIYYHLYTAHVVLIIFNVTNFLYFRPADPIEYLATFLLRNKNAYENQQPPS